MSEERVTLDMLGELMLSMQADLQVVSSAMLRLKRSIDRLCDEILRSARSYAPRREVIQMSLFLPFRWGHGPATDLVAAVAVPSE